MVNLRLAIMLIYFGFFGFIELAYVLYCNIFVFLGLKMKKINLVIHLLIDIFVFLFI